MSGKTASHSVHLYTLEACVYKLLDPWLDLGTLEALLVPVIETDSIRMGDSVLEIDCTDTIIGDRSDMVVLLDVASNCLANCLAFGEMKLPEESGSGPDVSSSLSSFQDPS